MTAIVAVEHGGRVFMAGDSALSTEDGVWIQSEPKVFRRGPVVIGVAGLARWETLWRYVIDVPRLTAGADPGRWINVELAAEVRKAAEHEGFTHEGGFIKFEDCEAMVAIGSKLYAIEADLCAWRPLCGYHAIGSGAGPARTSLRETDERHLQPKTRLKRALQRAQAETPFVREPFHYEST